MGKMGTHQQYVFNMYFNKKMEQPEKARQNSLAYLKNLFEIKAKFSCIAIDQEDDTLVLRGYVNLNSRCKQAWFKQMIGKYSSCKPSFFGDMVSLCRLLHVHRDLTVTGRLPCTGGNSIKNMKSFASDPKFVKKILLESIDKKDAKLDMERVKEKEAGNRSISGGI